RSAALDETGYAEAVVAAVDELALEVRLLGPACFLEAVLEGRAVIAAVARGLAEAFARLHDRKRIRHFFERDQVAAADVEPVEAEISRRHVKEPVHEEAALEAAWSSKRARRRLVGRHRVRREVKIGHAIGPGHKLRDVTHRRAAVRPHIGS